MIKYSIIIISLIAIAVIVLLWTKASQSQKQSPSLGLVNSQLKPCPDKPNCVSSFASPSDNQHFMNAYSSPDNPLPQVRKVLQSMNLSIVISSESYIHAISKSSFFGFIDDVEFYYDIEKKQLHFRSASRVGHSDLKANRKRITKILNQIR